MNISAEISRYLLLKGSLSRDPTARIGTQTVKRTQAQTHLGVWIDEKRTFLQHIENIRNKSIKIMNKITRLAINNYKITLETFKLHHNAILVAISSNGVSVWGHRLKMVNPAQKILQVQRGTLLRITGAFRTTSTDALAVLVGVVPLDLEVREKLAQKRKPEEST